MGGTDKPWKHGGGVALEEHTPDHVYFPSLPPYYLPAAESLPVYALLVIELRQVTSWHPPHDSVTFWYSFTQAQGVAGSPPLLARQRERQRESVDGKI